MKPNFPNFRVRYSRDVESIIVKDFDFVFDISSINFDINQTVIGNNTPFTTEMSFELRLDDIEAPADNNLAGVNALITGYDLSNTTDFTAFLKDVVFNTTELQIEYADLNNSTPDLISSGIAHASVIFQSPNITDVTGSVWLVQLKFIGVSPDPQTALVANVFFPKLIFNQGKPFNITANIDDGNFGQFNSELKLNYELLVVPTLTNTASDPGLNNTIGKVADEIADSFVNLGSTIASQLTNTVNARLQPVTSPVSYDIALWLIIKKSTDDLRFSRYQDFMDAIFCGKPNLELTGGLMAAQIAKLDKRRALPFMGVDAYRSVKVATEAFVMVNCMADLAISEEDLLKIGQSVTINNGVPDEATVTEWWKEYRRNASGAVEPYIPYLSVIRRKLGDSPIKTTTFGDLFDEYATNGVTTQTDSTCYGIIQEKLNNPCFLELIWSYWHEESMMVQGLNSISRRFQNIKGPKAVDPLSNLEIDPLRPLSNLFWGYIQDEQHLLTVRRRAYEYDHHYGISLQGTAVQNMRFADSRSKFIEAFHMLLNQTHQFYKQADDMTVNPDGFPILNALRETHLILSEGAHNQYGDLPSTSRAEMLMQQWLLARPEFREFLPTRIMVAYPEPWMDRVSSLNNLMGWTKTSVLHFHDLAVFGEQLLLTIRFGNWANVFDSNAAANWARFWRPQVQSYIHAYRAATGVDLTNTIPGGRVDAQAPSVHLYRRLLEERGRVA